MFVLKTQSGEVAGTSAAPIVADLEADCFRSSGQAWLDPRPSTGGFVEEAPDPPRVPAKVTARQAIQALIGIGVYEEDVEAVIDGIADPTQQRVARNFWRRSNDFERANPTLNAIAPALGLTQAQLDDLFILAASL